MRLVDQPDASLLKFIPSKTCNADRFSFYENVGFAEADGVRFICPKCTDGHSVIVWFRDRGLPDVCFNGWEGPPPKGWIKSGSSLADLTLIPSIDLKSSCRWHGVITNGEVF